MTQTWELVTTADPEALDDRVQASAVVFVTAQESQQLDSGAVATKVGGRGGPSRYVLDEEAC